MNKTKLTLVWICNEKQNIQIGQGPNNKTGM